MEMDLYRILSEYGIRGFIFAFLVFLGTAIVKSNWFSNWWSKLTDKILDWVMKRKVKVKENKHEISESDIINHDIFNYIDFWTYSKVPTFQFSTEYRTIIFKKYLTIYLKCYKKGLSDFLQKKDYQTMDQSQLWKSFLELINKIVWDYERECDEASIPKIIVLKMKSKNNDTITLTIDLIESISNSQFYEGDKNFLKMYSILNILLSILENTISNSESVCNSINGQIKGLSVIENGRKVTEL
jgi:hypothetical protein